MTPVSGAAGPDIVGAGAHLPGAAAAAAVAAFVRRCGGAAVRGDAALVLLAVGRAARGFTLGESSHAWGSSPNTLAASFPRARRRSSGLADCELHALRLDYRDGACPGRTQAQQ